MLTDSVRPDHLSEFAPWDCHGKLWNNIYFSYYSNVSHFQHNKLWFCVSIICSYFSPVIKSIAKRPNSVSVVSLDDIEERDVFISKLESRFLYLAADARSIIRSVK